MRGPVACSRHVLTSSRPVSSSVSPHVATPIPSATSRSRSTSRSEEPDPVRELSASERPVDQDGRPRPRRRRSGARGDPRAPSRSACPRAEYQSEHERRGRENPGGDEVHVAPGVRRRHAGLEHRLDEPIALRRSQSGLEPAQHPTERDEPDTVAPLQVAVASDAAARTPSSSTLQSLPTSVKLSTNSTTSVLRLPDGARSLRGPAGGPTRAS